MRAPISSATAPRSRKRWPSAKPRRSIRCLHWAAETLGARFRLGAGVTHVEQPPESIEAIRTAIEDFDDPVGLAALSVMTTLSGSALLALAVARGRLSPEEAWRAAHVDEDFQAERWGADGEARARREARWREFEAAALAASASG